MATWTTIDANISWQLLSIAQELATAYNKRADVAGSATIEAALGVSVIDTNVSVFDFVSAMQSGIEAIATYFADADQPLSGGTTLPSGYAGTSAAMTDAGLTASGYWRRIADGASNPNDWTNYNASGWSYGRITDKDLAGPWLFADLQTALSGLTRVVRLVPGTGESDPAAESGCYFATDTVPFVSNPPAAPDAPYDQYVAQTTTDWFFLRTVQRVLSGSNVYFLGDVEQAADTEITGLKTYSKSIAVVALPTETLTDGATTDYYGLGWDMGELNVYASTSGHTSDTWEFSHAVAVATFDDLFSGFSSGQYGTYQLWIDFDDVRVVVDYDFNP